MIATHKPTQSHKTYNEAVILLNMGGPNTIFEVELFLKNMFNDSHILMIKNSIVRKIVASMIVNSRLEIAKKNYELIGSKSPITELTFELIKKLQELDSARYYTYAMRYTPPFSDAVIGELREKNITKITLFSMYPQYSYTTMLSSLRDFLSALKKQNYNPEIKVVESYADDSGFVESCVEKIEETKQNFSDFVLILSAHSIPYKLLSLGDPYKDEVEKSAESIKNALRAKNIHFKDIVISYQSKIGPIKWLTPSTIDIIKKYKDSKLMLYPIAFSIDNLETRYELDIEDRKLATNLGVKDYVLCSCPNQSTTFAKAIINLVNFKGKSITDAKI